MMSLHLDLRSYVDLRTPSSLDEVGRSFDRHPRLCPEIVDRRDPPRRRVESMEAKLSEIQSGLKARQRDSYFFARKKDPQVLGVVDLHTRFRWEVRHRQPDGSWGDVEPSKLEPSRLSGGWELGWLRANEALDEFVDLFCELAVAMDAYWGMVATTAALGRFPLNDRTEFNLRDIGVVNLFGPALLAHWGGPERLIGIGCHQRALPNGGLVIWATEAPEDAHVEASSVTDFAWKQPFYEALGKETFWTEHGACEEAGVALPTVETQLTFARQFEG